MSVCVWRACVFMYLLNPYISHCLCARVCARACVQADAEAMEEEQAILQAELQAEQQGIIFVDSESDDDDDWGGALY